MENKELENRIKKVMNLEIKPDASSLNFILSKFEEDKTVTKEKTKRYYIWTAMSNIINNKNTDIVDIWKSKRLILVPSFILIFIISVFTLSPYSSFGNKTIIKLAEQDTLIEEQYVNEDDTVVNTLFESPEINDLSTLQNEI